MTELEKYKKAFELACEYDWNSDYFGCHLPCKTDDCWGKQSCIECTQKYLLQQAEQSDTKPMTNRQWLESLSDEELATFLENLYSYKEKNICHCKYGGGRYPCKPMDCVCGYMDWLQAEHKESEQ